jgi:UDP-N-acetylmuramate dehydrogenase
MFASDREVVCLYSTVNRSWCRLYPMDMKENQTLAPLTTFGIGGPARWFVEAGSESEIVDAVAWAREREVALFVLGGGSNLLVSDAGFDGLVLHVGVKGIEQADEVFRAGAGESWEHCVRRSTEAGYAGLECLAGIPGSVGGTPVQNVGAYGQEVASVIERVRAFDVKERAFVELRNEECGFAYRRSRFNTVDRGRYIVTRVDYRLRAGGSPELAYADLKLHFRDWVSAPSLIEVAAAVRGIRQGKGMLIVEGDPDCRSAGSFFKNPSVGVDVAERVRAYAESAGVALRVFPGAEGQVKIPAAWLIEQAGFKKGYAAGAAGISSRHTLALINRGGASAEEIRALAGRIADGVEERFGIRLEMEPVMVGY